MLLSPRDDSFVMTRIDRRNLGHVYGPSKGGCKHIFTIAYVFIVNQPR